MATFTLDNSTKTQINYEVIKGILPETTMFVHGNLASTRWWYPLEEEIKRANKGTLAGDMILVDFRGCGKSSDPQALEEIAMTNLANDFVMLAESLKYKTMNLVGHSTGGLIVGLMLAQKGQLFNKAVLLDPVGAQGVKFDSAMIGAFEAMKADKNLVATVMGSTIYQNNPETDFFKQVVVEDAFRAVQKVGLMVLQNIDNLDVRSNIKTVTNPVLVLHGEHDQLLSVDASKEFAQLLSKGQFEIVANQGHCTNAENPKKLLEILNRFLFA